MMHSQYVRSLLSTVISISLAVTLSLTGCGKDNNKDQKGNASQNSAVKDQKKGNAASQIPAVSSQKDQSQTPTDNKSEATANVNGLSKSASVDGMSIKRLEVGEGTMDVFDPKPKGANGFQPGALVLAMCGPRMTDDNVSALSNATYPISLSENSQVILHRDTSYQFADGTSASNLPSEVVISCE